MEPAEPRHGEIDELLDLIRVGDVGLLEGGRRAELRRHLLAARGIHVGDHDLGAFLDEELDGCAADAARAARDDRDLSRQFLAHSSVGPPRRPGSVLG